MTEAPALLEAHELVMKALMAAETDSINYKMLQEARTTAR